MKTKLKKAIKEWLKENEYDNWEDFKDKEVYDENSLTTLIDRLGEQDKAIVQFYIHQTNFGCDYYTEARVFKEKDYTIIFDNDAYFELDTMEEFIESVIEMENKANQVLNKY